MLGNSVFSQFVNAKHAKTHKVIAYYVTHVYVVSGITLVGNIDYKFGFF